MDYKNDWEKSKERFHAFWKGEVLDRCCVAVTAPKDGSKYTPEPFPQNKEDKIKYWTDGEWILKRNRQDFESTFFGGEAFPQVFLNLGVSAHAGFFKNAKYQMEDGTMWFFPSIHDWDHDVLEFNRESFLYQKTQDLAKYLVQESKGSYFVSMTDDGGNADALAHLRGSEELLMDMMIEPDLVHQALDKMQVAWLDISQKVFDITSVNNEGGSTIGWLHTWAPGKHAQMQCDISVMISPALFQQFSMPELQAQCDWLDYPLYHFDGIDQIKHLDALLSIDKLKVIQWTHVAGEASPVKYLPELQKIQKAGKNLLIKTNLEDYEVLMENLSSKGLYLQLTASSEQEACQILKMAEKLTHE